ncbi:hypothetical protein [Polaromonas glacialis]|uniref:hypothetical protein n=1 Tax=Polaromonas glacialis TaxID=866564 RepID=UPI0012EBA2BF|nr:hypothetical protein [Polaromonas glacialis]
MKAAAANDRCGGFFYAWTTGQARAMGRKGWESGKAQPRCECPPFLPADAKVTGPGIKKPAVMTAGFLATPEGIALASS